jgi:hypothetical protein
MLRGQSPLNMTEKRLFRYTEVLVYTVNINSPAGNKIETLIP